MDNKSDDHLFVVQATIYYSRQAPGYKINKYDSKLDKLTEMIKKTMCHTPYILVVMTVLNNIIS